MTAIRYILEGPQGRKEAANWHSLMRHRDEMIVHLYGELKSTHRVAQTVGMSRNRVTRILKAYEVELRPQGQGRPARFD